MSGDENSFTGVDDIVDRFEKMSKGDELARFDEIDANMQNGILDIENVTQEHLVYLHVRLHFFFQVKVPPITREKIKEFHNKVVPLLERHSKYDTLDE